jgi:phage tail protein X
LYFTIDSFFKYYGKCDVNRLNQHLKANNVLAPEQFGFRTGITFEKAIFTLTDNVLSAFNQ